MMNQPPAELLPEDTSGWEEWHAEYFEHLLNHPELVLLEPPAVRTFHICIRHEVARAVLTAGRIPPDFKCPFGIESCPMRKLLDVQPNRALQLIPLAEPHSAS